MAVVSAFVSSVGQVVGEAIELSPPDQFSVELFDHLNRVASVISRQQLSEVTPKPFRLIIRSRGDHMHRPTRTALTDNAMTQKGEAVIDLSELGFLHIQCQMQRLLRVVANILIKIPYFPGKRFAPVEP
jgi:hypothetical protein